MFIGIKTIKHTLFFLLDYAKINIWLKLNLITI